MKSKSRIATVFAAVLVCIVAANVAHAITVTGTIADDQGWGGDLTRWTSATFQPRTEEVTISGWVELSNLTSNGAIMVGLFDKKYYDDQSESGYMGGAYAYFGNTGSNNKVGPSDGNMGGEIVQTFGTEPRGTTGNNKIYFNCVIGDGTVEVSYSTDNITYVGPYSDTYGDIEALNTADAYDWTEFEHGAYAGIDLWDDGLGSVDYSITVVPEPATLALMALGGVGMLLRRKRSK